MTIPDYQTLMLPLLKIAADRKEHSVREAVKVLSKTFGLSEEERNTLLPSGTQTVIYNRVGWARTYMKKAGLIETPKRGHFRITQIGLDLLEQNPDRIDEKVLNQYEEFRTFKAKHREKTENEDEIGWGFAIMCAFIPSFEVFGRDITPQIL